MIETVLALCGHRVVHVVGNCWARVEQTLVLLNMFGTSCELESCLGACWRRVFGTRLSMLRQVFGQLSDAHLGQVLMEVFGQVFDKC